MPEKTGRDAGIVSPEVQRLLNERPTSLYGEIMAGHYGGLTEEWVGNHKNGVNAADETHAAVITRGVYDDDAELMNAGFQALRLPQNMWQAAAWVVRRGVVMPSEWTERLAGCDAGKNAKKALKLAIAKLDMSLASLTPANRMQGHGQELVTSSLTDLDHILDNAEVFDKRARARGQLAVARTLRDGGWVKAAGGYRKRINEDYADEHLLKAFDVVLGGMRGGMLSRRRRQPDPQWPVPPSRRLTFKERRSEWIDMTPDAVLAKHPQLGRRDIVRKDVMGHTDYTDELELLLSLSERRKASYCFDEVFRGRWINYVDFGVAEKLQAAALMHVYADQSNDIARLSSLRGQMELLGTSPSLHMTHTEKANAKVTMRESLKAITDEAVEIEDVRERTRLLLDLLRNATQQLGTKDEQVKRLRKVTKFTWTTWRMMTPHDLALRATVNGAQELGIDTRCAGFWGCNNYHPCTVRCIPLVQAQ